MIKITIKVLNFLNYCHSRLLRKKRIINKNRRVYDLICKSVKDYGYLQVKYQMAHENIHPYSALISFNAFPESVQAGVDEYEQSCSSCVQPAEFYGTERSAHACVRERAGSKWRMKEK
jgi:hypothetical protein